MKRNVLVFPCGSEIGLEIYRSLNKSTHFNLFGGSSVADHGKFVYRNYIDNIPFVHENNFVEELNSIIKTNKIDFIIPAHDSVLLKLAEAADEGKLGCEVLTSPLTTCKLCRSKLKTYELFENIIPTPKIYESANAIQSSDYPVFLKPDVGQGSKGTQIAESAEDVKYYIARDPSLLILEYLPGREFTVDCFTDKTGNLLFCEGRERKRVLNGISVNSESFADRRFMDMAKKINRTLKLNGVWFFQVKENKTGDLILMEIAPRVAGTMGVIRGKGVNLALLSLFNVMGLKVEILENDYSLVIDRALQNRYRHNIKYDNVYMDLDDLIVFDKQVNLQAITFIFQCINKGINIHLLTRHRADLQKTLKKYKLIGLFDEIINVKDKENKGQYIREHNSIFIDDSFQERKNVYDMCAIPVFDSHMIEILMEPF